MWHRKGLLQQKHFCLSSLAEEDEPKIKRKTEKAHPKTHASSVGSTSGNCNLTFAHFLQNISPC